MEVYSKSQQPYTEIIMAIKFDEIASKSHFKI